MAIFAARVPRPFVQHAAHAGGARPVHDRGLDLRQEPERIDLRPVAHVESASIKARTVGHAAAEAAECIYPAGLPIVERNAGVHEAHGVARVGISPPVVRLGDRIVSGIAGDDLVARIDRRAIGPVVVPVFGGDEQAALAERQPPGTPSVEQAAVRELEIRPRSARQAVRCARVAHKASPRHSEFRRDRRARDSAFEDDVDHAGDRVRAVLRGGTVAQYLDVLDSRHGNGVQVHARRASSDARVQMHERALMTALAVDEHQHLVGAQPPKRGRTHRVRAVGNRGARKIERRSDRFEDLRRFGIAARSDLFLRNDVDRNGFLGLGADRARPDRHGLRKADAQRDVEAHRSGHEVDLDDLRWQAEPFHFDLRLPAGRERSRDLQRVTPGAIRCRGRVETDDGDNCAGHGKTVSAGGDDPRECCGILCGHHHRRDGPQSKRPKPASADKHLPSRPIHGHTGPRELNEEPPFTAGI